MTAAPAVLPRATSQELAALYTRASANVPDERREVLHVREGALPSELRGVLFRNGPGKNEAFGTPYDHPFDGDGMVLRFAFDGQRVHYTNRWVRTSFFLAEERARRMLYRGFGTNLPGGLVKNLFRTTFKNAANTSVVMHGGALLALWEGGLPHALAPDTLATLGPYDFEGQLDNRASRLSRMLAPSLPFSAHPKLCPRTGELFGFGTAYGPEDRLMLYRVSPEGRMHEPESLPLEQLTFMHDFVLTEKNRLFFQVPARFGVARALSGLTSPADSIRFGEGPTRIRVVPRDGSRETWFSASPAFVFHFVNGFEREDGTIVIDAMRSDRFPAMPDPKRLRSGEPSYPAPLLTRYELDTKRGEVRETTVSRVPAELPTVAPSEATRRHGLAFAIAGTELGSNERLTSPFFSRVIRFDRTNGTESYRDFGHALPGEPLFVPREGDTRSGWVLTLVYEASRDKSALHVLRAEDLETVCVLDLPHGVPPGFHGTWVPEARA